MPIIVNGQSYDSWDQVPPEVRAQLSHLPDADHNGVPDLMEGKLDSLFPQGLHPGTNVVTSTSSIEVNGQKYDSLDQVPPEMRDLVQRALSGQLFPQGQPPAPGAAAPAAAPAPGPDQVLLNGQPVTLTSAGATPAKKGFLRRLFGR